MLTFSYNGADVAALSVNQFFHTAGSLFSPRSAAGAEVPSGAVVVAAVTTGALGLATARGRVETTWAAFAGTTTGARRAWLAAAFGLVSQGTWVAKLTPFPAAMMTDAAAAAADFVVVVAAIGEAGTVAVADEAVTVVVAVVQDAKIGRATGGTLHDKIKRDRQRERSAAIISPSATVFCSAFLLLYYIYYEFNMDFCRGNLFLLRCQEEVRIT